MSLQKVSDVCYFYLNTKWSDKVCHMGSRYAYNYHFGDLIWTMTRDRIQSGQTIKTDSSLLEAILTFSSELSIAIQYELRREKTGLQGL